MEELPKKFNVDSIGNIEELRTYWQSCCHDTSIPVVTRAYKVVGVVSNDHFDDWQNDEIMGNVVTETFEIAAELELEQEVSEDDSRWVRILHLIEQI